MPRREFGIVYRQSGVALRLPPHSRNRDASHQWPRGLLLHLEMVTMETVMPFVARRKLTRRIWSVVLLCVSQLQRMEAATGSNAGTCFDVSPVEQGWQPSTVTSLTQSRDGYLWVGTYNGLLR